MVDLAQLISDLETQEPSRELADRVLLAWGWQEDRVISDKHGTMLRRNDGAHPILVSRGEERPNPLQSIDDALLGVPEGWHLLSIWFTDGDDWRASVMRDDWRDREPGTSTIFSAVGLEVMGQPTIPLALTIAICKARLAISAEIRARNG